MNICTCNQCGNIYDDPNPQTGATNYPDAPLPSLEKIMTEMQKPEGDYWGCPVCMTDGFLVDGIDPISLNDESCKILDEVNIPYGTTNI